MTDLRPVVPRWQPHNFAFHASGTCDNPFSVSFSALVQSPGTGSFVTNGFYDGDGQWILRIAPWAEGTWSIQTRSSDTDLDGRESLFECVANDNHIIHGGLLVDNANPHHFVYEDGSPYFLMGYECDWLWALDMSDPDMPTVLPFLDKLVEYGFNHVILNTYAHDCSWQEGRIGPDDYGPPPMYAWEGTNEHPDHSRFNLAYWQHYDRVIDALYRRGIVAHLMIKVYNKMVNWPAPSSIEDNRFFQWVIARYAAYPNVVWDFSKESNNEPSLSYKLDRFRFIRKHDPYRRLLTTHDDEAEYESGVYCNELDFHSDQHHSDWHAEVLRKRDQHAWPIINVEFGYEHGPEGSHDMTYGVVQSPEELCRRAWEICMAGGYVAYYYTYTAWDVIRPNDTPPGYRYFKLMKEFFEGTSYKLLKPADDLVSEGYCLANPGVEYVVFLDGVESCSMDLESAVVDMDGYWYHPFNGTRTKAGTFAPGTTDLSSPFSASDEPAVLHLMQCDTENE